MSPTSARSRRGAPVGGSRRAVDGLTFGAEAEDPDGSAAAYELGLPVLSNLVAEALDGICVVDRARRIVYANAAACATFGASLDALLDRDYQEFVAPWAWPAMLARFPDQLGGGPASATTTLLRPDGVEREVVYSPFLLTVRGEPHGGAVFRDVTSSQEATRTALALTQAGAQPVGSSPERLLAGIARHAVAATRAGACGVIAVGEDGRIAHHAGAGPGYDIDPVRGRSPIADVLGASSLPAADLVAALTAGLIIVDGPPSNPVVLVDCRSRCESDPEIRGLVSGLTELDWQTAVWLPLSWQSRVFGVFGVHLPAGVTAPTEAELACYLALADQASLAIITARLADRARRAATLAERERLARDLHDSVTQALFSIGMHARTAEVQMARAGLSGELTLSGPVRALADVARESLAQMRALISELRPEPRDGRVR